MSRGGTYAHGVTHVFDTSTVLAVFAGVLFVIGLGLFATGELLVAGVVFLALSFTIYVRETRS